MTSKVKFTHHARRQWANRFDDIADNIEDEFAVAKPASKRVRQTLAGYTHARIRCQRTDKKKPIFFVSRRCVFPAIKYHRDNSIVVLTVYMRKRDV